MHRKRDMCSIKTTQHTSYISTRCIGIDREKQSKTTPKKEENNHQQQWQQPKMPFIVAIHAINVAALCCPVIPLHFYICQLVCLILCHDSDVWCAIQNCRLGSARFDSFESNWYIVFAININYKISESLRIVVFGSVLMVLRVLLLLLLFSCSTWECFYRSNIAKINKRNNAFCLVFGRSSMHHPFDSSREGATIRQYCNYTWVVRGWMISCSFIYCTSLCLIYLVLFFWERSFHNSPCYCRIFSNAFRSKFY